MLDPTALLMQGFFAGGVRVLFGENCRVFCRRRVIPSPRGWNIWLRTASWTVRGAITLAVQPGGALIRSDANRAFFQGRAGLRAQNKLFMGVLPDESCRAAMYALRR
jgi:hypothetical protein